MRLLAAAGILVAVVVSGVTGAAAQGRFEQHVVGGRTVRVYLPRGFRPGLPVIVAQDAQNLFGGGPYGSWDLHLAVENARRPAVVLASEHRDKQRIADYDGSYSGGGAARYNRWVRTDLLPWARRLFGVSASLDHVIGIGSSMGAHPLLDDLIEEGGKPQTYGAWAVMSPALSKFERRLLRRVEQAPALRRGRLFLMSGDTGRANDDVVENEELRDHLEKGRGWVHGKDLRHWRARGREHDEGTWRDYTPMALDATLPP